jgi:transposase
MAEFEKKTKRYPTDLTDEEWAQIEPFLPGAAKSGRPARTGLREVLNAIRYLARSGSAGGCCRRTIRLGRRSTGGFAGSCGASCSRPSHDVALMLDRERVGREASPTGGVIDNQSVKAPEAKTRGYDAGKKIAGRKRHIAVDTDSRLLMVNLTTANISEGLFDSSSRGECPLFARSGYRRKQFDPRASAVQDTHLPQLALALRRLEAASKACPELGEGDASDGADGFAN